MSYTSGLLDGLCRLLADAGLGVYDTTAPISEGTTGIFRQTMPADPDRAMAVNAYPVEDGALRDVTTGVQIRMRAGRDPAGVDDMADAVRDVLHNRTHYPLGAIHVEVSWRNSQAWIGQDDRSRMEATANYYFRTTYTGPHQDE